MSKHKNKAGAIPRIDPYLEGLMAKLLEHLVGLEKKLDTVIAQTAGKSSGNGDRLKPSQTPEVKQFPRRDRVLYEAICADCHKVCEVPFRPSEDRPVYCKECFKKRKSDGSVTINTSHRSVSIPQKMADKPNTMKEAAPLIYEMPKKIKKKQLIKKSKKKK